jgi:prepilin-type N-terminal cleavage/methylation domain-containing protein
VRDPGWRENPLTYNSQEKEETMNNFTSSSFKSQSVGDQDDKGFTLIEILIAIVLVGILSAVAVVGISNLVSKGTTSACGASNDAAKAASAVYFTNANAYPTTMAAMVTGGQLTLPSGMSTNAVVSVAPATPTGAAIGMQTTGGPWYLTMTAGVGTAAPTFVCT